MAFSSVIVSEFDWKALKSLQHSFILSLDNVATSNSSDLFAYNGDCALLLTQSGKVFSTGKSTVGCLGGEVTETAEPVELKELSGVAGVCVCGYLGDALAYTTEGKVYVWGNNAKPTPCNRPQLVLGLTDIRHATCNMGHYLALTKSGKLYEWRGGSTYGELQSLSTSPKVVDLNQVIMSIACGPYHSLALTKDGQVYSWGRKYINFDYVDQPMTKIPLPGETVAKVACGETHSLILTHSGKLYTWGYNDYGMGDGSIESATPVEVGQSIGRCVDVAVNGWSTNAAVSHTGAIYMWGMGENNKSVRVPTVTECIEMQQVFANISVSQYSWPCKTKTSASSNMVVVEDSSIAGKLKASVNDEQDCNEAQKHHIKEDVNLKKEIAKLNEDNVKLKEENYKLQEENNKLKDELKQVNANLIDELKEGNAKLKNELKEEIAKLKDELKEENAKIKEDNIKLKDELKVDNAKLKDELKEENAKIKEDNAKVKDELKEENAKIKEDNAKLKDELKVDNAKLKDELKEDNAKLKDELQYQFQNLTALLQSQQERKEKHNEAAIIPPEGFDQFKRGLQLPVYHEELEDDPTKVHCSHNVEENDANLKEELANLRDEFKNLKLLLSPQEGERNYSVDNRGSDIQRERRGRITPATDSVVNCRDNTLSNQNRQEERSYSEGNRGGAIQRGRRGRITPTTDSVANYRDNTLGNQNKQ